MLHKAVEIKYLSGTSLELTFQDGIVKRYDMRTLFNKYPQLIALTDRKLFTSGHLTGYGIIWNDDLDIETYTIYEDGETVRRIEPARYLAVGKAVASARADKGLSQSELAKLSGIDQSDISKIERGIANPSIGTLMKIAQALDGKLNISIDFK